MMMTAQEFEVLRERFLAHPRAVSIMRRWPGGEAQAVWVAVECENIDITARGLVVGGDVVDGDWDLDGRFLLFDIDDDSAGAFYTVNGWCGSVKEIARLDPDGAGHGPTTLMRDGGTNMDSEQTRREMDALFPGLEQNETLQAAFEAHPGSAAFLERQPELGRTIPWVLVGCDVNGRQITGLVVDGIVVRHGWDLREEFVLFSADMEPAGRFVTIPGGEATVSVIGTTPAAVGFGERPDASALLREMAEVSAAWASNAELVRSWHACAVLHRLPSYPDCFAEFHRDCEVTRGLVIGGHLDRDGQWDFTQYVQVIVRSGETVVLDPTQADNMEILHGHDVAMPARRG
ncbi:hypothetical protein ACMAUO_20235 [Gluconacetobacter sp. Hr-1-5]|uniref:hypothetical protein n=1 Tax=Gluconacetobacter sp. Hr-1-5 TaxID=3395370 RepID=UPI003B51F72C